jgi:DNA-binding protein H-NS
VRAKTGRVAVRYRNPDDATQQWTGRGRQPKWIKEWLEADKSLDLLRV